MTSLKDIMKEKRNVMLVILDGWGIGEETDSNAVYLAKTPNMDKWAEIYPNTSLTAHNGAVGLPEGQMGNSEVGHLNIGAGRVVFQDFTRINNAIRNDELKDNEHYTHLINTAIEKKSALHLMGLISDGGVHSHLEHLYAFVSAAKNLGLAEIFIHCFMDGRDTPPNSGKNYIADLQIKLKEIGAGKIATVIGRYYAMDRDNRWDRVALAWDAMVNGNGKMSNDPLAAVSEAYDNDQTDEFIKPVVISSDDGQPVASIKDNDCVLFFNFRADRARQLTHAFNDLDFAEFETKKRPALAEFATCTMYEKDFNLPILFPPLSNDRILGEEVSRHGLKQLRIAETEKYAHVTYFFNGGRENPFPNEDRALLDSPRDVATYDLKPEMSAYNVTDELEKRLKNNPYNLIVVNFANGDMVGHTGKLDAAINACEVVDTCLGRLIDNFTGQGGVVLVTADHGNADMMFDFETNGPHTAHTLNKVPFILINDDFREVKLKNDGALKDIAPTIMALMGLPIPDEMTGECLIEN